MLGEIALDREVLGVSLISGPVVARAKIDYLIEYQKENQQQQWILFNQRRGRDEKTQIARIWLDGSQLKFSWSENARDEANSQNLRNCLIRLEAGSHSQVVALRKPVAIGKMKLTDKNPKESLVWIIHNLQIPGKW